LLLFAKMRHNVPPNYKVLECCQLLDTCFTMVDCYEARSSWVSTNFCIFPSLIISLDFNICNKQFQKINWDFRKSLNYCQTWKGDISECWVGWLLLVTNTLTKQNHAQNKSANSGGFLYHPVDQVWLKLDIMNLLQTSKKQHDMPHTSAIT
jgi:hypothetical protein